MWIFNVLFVFSLDKLLNKQLSWLNTHMINTLRLRQNGPHFPDDIFKWIFFNENVWISIQISLTRILKYVLCIYKKKKKYSVYIVWRVTLTLNFQDAFRCQCTIDSSYLYYMTCDHYYEYCLFFFPSCHQGISSHDIIDCRQSANSCLPRQFISSSWYIFQPLNCSVFVYLFIYWSILFIHFQIVISFSRIVSYYSNISVWNWFNTINIHSALHGYWWPGAVAPGHQ